MPKLRRQTRVHASFHEVGKSGKGPKQVGCNYCNWKTTVNATRMENHLGLICKRCPIDLKEFFVKKRAKSTDVFSCNTAKPTSACLEEEPSSETRLLEASDSGLSVTKSPSSSNSRSSSRLSNQSINTFLDRMTDPDQRKGTALFARAVYASTTPLHIVESEHWQDFFRWLRPMWHVPSRHDLSNPLLTAEYNRVKSAVEHNVNIAPSLGLMCDGWTNINQHSILNFVITTPKPVFYKSLPTGKMSHTAQYMSDVMIDVMEEVGVKKFSCIVTDNAANMKSAWNIIMEKYSHVTAYGCVAHGMHFLINDLIKLPSLEKIVAESKIVIKEITGSAVLKATFEEHQNNCDVNISLKMPVVTRWGTHVHMMKSLLVNKKSLKQLAIDDEAEKQLSASSKRLIVSEIFWDRIQHFSNLLEPVAGAITFIEGDTPLISLVCKLFNDISASFKDLVTRAPVLKTEETRILMSLDKQTSFCVTNLHKAANVLDPKRRGQDIDESGKLDAAEFISSMAEESDELDAEIVLEEYANYTTKSEFFSRQFLWTAAERTENITWWNAFCSSKMLSKIAVKILSLPATSAACERTFSAYSNIHTNKRNRLTNERAGKITYINYNLKLKLPLPETAVETDDTYNPALQHLISELERENGNVLRTTPRQDDDPDDPQCIHLSSSSSCADDGEEDFRGFYADSDHADNLTYTSSDTESEMMTI